MVTNTKIIRGTCTNVELMDQCEKLQINIIQTITSSDNCAFNTDMA